MSGSSPVESIEELQQIIKMLHKRSPLAAMLIEFEARTGLRYSDTSRLTFKDIMVNGVPRARFNVIQSKSYKARLAKGMVASTARKKSEITIHVNAQLSELIRRLFIINGHNKLAFQSNHHLAKEGEAITIQYVNRQLNQIAAELGLNYQLSTHSMRKSFTQFLITAGASLNILRDALGHSDARTTNHYISTFSGDLKKYTTEINF